MSNLGSNSSFEMMGQVFVQQMGLLLKVSLNATKH